MFTDPLFLIASAACFVVLGILIMGIYTFSRGGEGAAKRSNTLMRYRIYAQAVALGLILLYIFTRGAGA